MDQGLFSRNNEVKIQGRYLLKMYVLLWFNLKLYKLILLNINTIFGNI